MTARELRYLLVNKPRGVASTRSDPHADRVIVDLVPNGRALFPVGRLDVDTTGLIILTNDGVLANRLMHPRYGVPKTYVARVRGKVSRRALGTLRQGVDLEDGPTSPADVRLKKQSAKTALVEITIHEGRKRQVRRMFVAVGLPVEELSRRRYGPLTDKGLEPGGYRELTGEEVEALRRAGEEVAGEVGKEVQGPPVMLAAEVADAPQPMSDAALVASDDAGPRTHPRRRRRRWRSRCSSAVRAPEPGEPDDDAEPSGEPDRALWAATRSDVMTVRFIPELAGITPYQPGLPIEVVQRRFGLEQVVKLASNEFPLPPFPEVKEVVTAALDRLQRYPDGFSTDLREALAAVYDRSPEQITVGCGTCELLYLLAHSVLERGDEVVLAQPSFTSYRDVIDIRGAVPVAVPLQDHTHDLEAMAAAVTPRTKMIFVCNPNNPTGTYVPSAEVARLVERVPDDVMVVIDEAYIEFVTAEDREGSLAIQKEHDNVVVLRTFSKIYGLCGLRTGYGICAPEVKQAVDKVRQPFNVNLLGQLAAIEALKHPDQVAERRETNARLRDLMVARLAAARARHGPHAGQLHARRHERPVRPARQGVRHAAVPGRDRARRQRAGVPRLGPRDRGYRGGDRVLPGQAGLARGRRPGRRRRETALSMMVIMHEAATDDEVAHVCARVEEVGRQRAHLAGRQGDGHRRHRRPRGDHGAAARGHAGRGPRGRDPAPVQAREPRVPAARHGDRRERRQDRRRALRAHRRPVLHRDAGAGAGGRTRRQGGRRPHAARRRVQAAHARPTRSRASARTACEMMAAARAETGLPIVTEVMDPRDLDVVCSYADVLQVGARNTQNFLLLAELGKAGKPVLLKRGPSTTIEELLMSAEYILKEGNRDVILCERGIRTFETATRNTLDVSAVPVIKLASHLPVVVDPSHSAGRLDLVLPLSLAGVAAGADGVLVETHPNPEHALCDGPQSLPTAAFGEYAGPRARPRALGGQDRLRPWSRQPSAPSPSSASASWAGLSGLAARERAGVADVRGFSQTQATLDLALERGAITTACGSVEEACAGADLIFVCTPVRWSSSTCARRSPPLRRTPWSPTSGAPRGRSCARSRPRSSAAASAGTRSAARRPPAWPTRAARCTRARPTS